VSRRLLLMMLLRLALVGVGLLVFYLLLESIALTGS
jgi:hypothetical protein